MARHAAPLVGEAVGDGYLDWTEDGSIPDDNPFPGSPIYSYGHRNPQGLAWQPGAGRLYATEHGPSGQQACCDEVNHVQPAMNYGWPQVFGGQNGAWDSAANT